MYDDDENLKITGYNEHVRTRIRFAMLRTTLIPLRGYRGKKMDCMQI